MKTQLTTCKKCGCYINPKYGAVSVSVHAGQHSGTKSDPKAPGDYDNICDDCNYGQ